MIAALILYQYTIDLYPRQTAVVQGLVLNQSQQHETGHATLHSRTSPASYGVLCKKLYDKHKHIGAELETDRHNGKQYAINLIHWFVKKVRLVGNTLSQQKLTGCREIPCPKMTLKPITSCVK